MKFSAQLQSRNQSVKTANPILQRIKIVRPVFSKVKLITIARTVSIFGLASAVLIPIHAAQASTALTTFDTGYCAGEEYGYTGSDQLVTVPAGATKMKVKAWGAGGGKDGGAIGGAGGYVEAEVPVVPGTNYQAVVGAIGQFTNQYGFGGKPLSASLYGGGLGGLFTGTAPVIATDQARAVLVAGGGGSGEKTAGQGILVHFGGNGGDPLLAGGQVGTMAGQDGFNNTGTSVPSSGGSGGGYEGGSAHQRGGPADSTGPTDNYGGGGGSNYINTALVTAGTTQDLFTPDWTNTPVPPNTGDIHYNSPTPPYITGQGIAGSGAKAGGHGLVVVQFDGCIPPIDTDADGIEDKDDLDDDNDGILDTVESPTLLGAITTGNITPNPSGSFTNNRGVDVPFTLTGSDPTLDFHSTMSGVTEGLQFRWVQPNTLVNFDVDLTLSAPVKGILRSIKVGDAAPGNTQVFANANKDVTISWPGSGSAVLSDPNGDISSHSDGAIIVSGAVLTVVGGAINTSTWSLNIDLAGVTAPILISYESVNFAAAKGNEGFAFVPVVDTDIDADGITDYHDLDSDNDGISDLFESEDADGLAADTNNDGTLSITESADTDSDGLIDVFEDGNLTADVGTPEVDNDTDGLPNQIDLDSDGDGIPDTIEARPTASYAANDGNVSDDDADSDGIIAMFDSNDASTADFGGDHANFNAPIDTDGDGIADWLDTDSDNDGIEDSVEVVVQLSPSYSDPDGIVSTTSADVYNESGDMSEIGFRESVDWDNDGVSNFIDLDDDNDGIVDTQEYSCNATSTPAWDSAVADGDTNAMLTLANGVTANVAITTGFQQAGFPTFTSSSTTLTVGQNGDYNPLSDGTEVVYTFSAPIVNHDFILAGIGVNDVNFDESSTVSFFLNGNPVAIGASNITQGGSFVGGLAEGTNTSPHAQYTFTLTSAVDEIRVKHVGHSSGYGSAGWTASSITSASCILSDVDADGIPDHFDLDSDNDGVSDLYESGDADGLAADANNDGTVSDTESVDTDTDGLKDVFEDGTLTTDTGSPTVDTDGDGINNQKDLDSDADGIPDTVEARPTAGFTVNDGDVSNDDADGDGVIALFDSNDASTADFGGDHANFNAPIDSDADGIPDLIDVNSDNDGYDDVTEGNLMSLATFLDTDSDGLDDGFNPLGYLDPDGLVNAPISDLQNADTDTTDADYRSLQDSDGDGTTDFHDLDDDNDGILDTREGYVRGTATVDNDADLQLTTGIIDGFASDVAVTVSTPDGEFYTPSAAHTIAFNEDTGAGTYTVDFDQPVFDFQAMLSSISLNLATDDIFLGNFGLTLGDGTVITTADFVIAADVITPNTELGPYQEPILGLRTGWNDDKLLVRSGPDVNSDGVIDYVADLIAYTAADPGQHAARIIFPDPQVNAKGVTSFSFELIGTGSGPYAGLDVYGTIARDTDGDGISDHLDLDSDNDGISDLYESGDLAAIAADTNSDGTLSIAEDADSDADGLIDIYEDGNLATDAGTAPVDSDADGTHDQIDLDSDGDGIPDTIEARPTTGYAVNDNNVTDDDADGDGVIALFDANDASTADFGGDHVNFNAPVDTDADATPDYLDADSDNDGKNDSGEITTPINPVYADPDGLIATTSPDLANESGDLVEVGFREISDIDGDGVPDLIDIDDDNDGIQDIDEMTCGILATAGWDAATVAGDTSSIMTFESGVTATVTETSAFSAAGYPNYVVAGPDLSFQRNGGFDLASDGAETVFTFSAPIINNTLSLINLGTNGVFDESQSVSFFLNGIQVAIGPSTMQNGGIYMGGIVAGIGASPQANYVFSINQPVDEIRVKHVGLPGGPYSSGYIAINISANGCAVPDFDADGIPNYLDADSDNDGITDTVEAGGVDADGDGIVDGFTDTDGDGLDDATNAAPLPVNDFDGDGQADYLDLDSDNDGLTDASEAGGTDTDGDGVIDGFTDANNDGLDDNTAATPLAVDDTDGDGSADHLDLDADGDGIDDILEGGGTDADGDGIVDTFTDADDNGLDDATEAAPLPDDDFDGDGVPDHLDIDSDNDGIPDAVEAANGFVDTDGDGQYDHLDLDADNDGIPDADEGPGDNADADGDGIDDYYDVDFTSGVDANNDGVDDTIAAEDSDGDGTPDYLDLDSDNDGLTDAYEAGGVDADGDGVIDGFTDADDDGLDDATSASPLPDPDTDGDGIANHLDVFHRCRWRWP